MKPIRTLVACLAIFICSCTSTFPNAKLSPEYPGVNPAAQSLVEEYFRLSKLNHLEFTKPVTLGFKKIDRGNVVGICTFGTGWREIDLDLDFWNTNNTLGRTALIFHELTHCYCQRKHDWAEGREYPNTEKARIKEFEQWDGGDMPGRFEDTCPSSIMFPVVLETDCLLKHYNEYMSEMFDRCIPY